MYPVEQPNREMVESISEDFDVNKWQVSDYMKAIAKWVNEQKLVGVNAVDEHSLVFMEATGSTIQTSFFHNRTELLDLVKFSKKSAVIGDQSYYFGYLTIKEDSVELVAKALYQ